MRSRDPIVRIAVAVGLALGAALSLAALAAAAPGSGPSLEMLRARGKTLYAVYCARCHGPDGTDTTLYAGTKSLLDVTQRHTAQEVIVKSMGSAAVTLEGEDAEALYAYLETFRSGGYARPEMLVETDWVATHLREPGIRLVDMRSAEAYAAGHIPGAVSLDERWLRNAEDRLTYLPAPEEFARRMGQAGISRQTRVVIYDDQGGRAAARLWYVLTAYGHERVSLVNGGWNRWVAEGRPVTQEVPTVMPTTYEPRLVPEITCTAPAILARKPDVVVLDVRSEAEYRGDQVSAGSARAGRIPGAVHVEWSEAVTGPHRVFKSAAELRRLYESRGITPDKVIVPY